VVRHLTLLQLDPTAAIAPNADLVAWSRLGSSYSPAGGQARRHRRPQSRRGPGQRVRQDVTFSKTMTAAVDHEIKDLAYWLQLDLTTPDSRDAVINDDRPH